MKGLFSALLVPFDEQGEIIEQGLREIVRHNVDIQGIDGLYVNGSSGENFMLSTEQKKQIFKIVSEENQGKVKLIAQVGSINLTEAIELGKYATELGYDSLSAVTPFYYKFTFEEIKDYYETIIKETGNNMIIYAIPALTGVSMSMAQFDELFQNEKIIGVKYTDGNFFLLERLRKEYPTKLIYSGFDEMLIYGAVSGVDGAIGSTYNVNGKRAKQIWDLCQEGKVAEAYEVQHVTNDLIEKVLDLGLYQTLKEILNVKGIQAGTVKRPMSSLDPAKKAEVKQLVEDFQL
ncbi:N-acetylneuraminate lyase [Heyndrickxia oleronia]|jgi:N-acetylneuraminate lyase|uniref:N-acetylneuraminate lyase n=1 Tax=Heyndrickxia oleronia TaxID=38875 RepID=UPI0009037B92|nr:N-acetylneuraminate lyase [Heyndrickxia oleronia]NYV65617.1 N-acetylneuraminate lyase [Bacillus sp. Gen3]OJH20802.1 N-acetylneuraminate lyase [Bacillus obstructivus]MCI1589087.1 N-acetylneuraminate lyase [Heyndrickxia oleronia]MCI1611821.1 N-acetylneuraminate lyase [Heyndrickxia oleronia]MCI1743172.1 N-acetylneuraminate lyase [Heyndrickxia oleronia]